VAGTITRADAGEASPTGVTSPHGQAATTHGAGSDTVLPLEPATPTGNPRWHSASHRTELASCAAAARSAIDQPI
jgi:hypothetical protein